VKGLVEHVLALAACHGGRLPGFRAADHVDGVLTAAQAAVVALDEDDDDEAEETDGDIVDDADTNISAFGSGAASSGYRSSDGSYGDGTLSSENKSGNLDDKGRTHRKAAKNASWRITKAKPHDEFAVAPDTSVVIDGRIAIGASGLIVGSKGAPAGLTVKGDDDHHEDLTDVERLLVRILGVAVDEANWVEHKVSLDSLCEMLGTNTQRGLGQAEAARRVSEFGANELPMPVENWVVWVWIKYMFISFAAVFWISWGLGVMAYGLKGLAGHKIIIFDYMTIMVTFLLYTTVSFAVQWNYAVIVHPPAGVLPPRCQVVRDGVTADTNSRNVALGDIISFKAGDIIAADIRICNCSADLLVSMKSISGDDKHIAKSLAWTDENVFYTRNMILAGTVVTRGRGRGIVVRTGASTIIGRCFPEIGGDETQQRAPSIMDEVHIFFFWSTMFSIFCFILGLFHGLRWYHYTDALLNIYTVSFSNAPEGLIAALIVCSVLGVRKMKNDGIIVKNTECIEKMAMADVLGWNIKTNTITENTMGSDQTGEMYKEDKA